MLAAVFNMLGPLLVGAAVASAIGGIVAIEPSKAVNVIAAGLVGAVAWNLVTWRRGLPSSSGHALVGGLVGAALVAGGTGAVQWGGLDGVHPVGVLGACIALAVSPPLGALAAFALVRAARHGARRASRRWRDVAQAGQWATSATLAFSHGANDAQKSVGIIAALLLADGRIDGLSAPLWAKVACGAALTVGTAAGGWSIVRTVGRRIYHLHPVDGLCSQGASAAVILGAHAALRAVGVMSRRHWFLPEDPRVLQLLRRQVAITMRGMDAFAAWAAGDAASAGVVHALEHEADTAKADLRRALRDAFVTPLDPEDLFALSRGVDWILNHAKDAIGQSEAMGCPPDEATAAMAALLAESVRRIEEGIARLAGRSGDPAESADAAIKAERRLEKVYRAAMAVLADIDDPRTAIGRQELYRRCSRMGETAVDVAERLIYAVLKES